MPQVYGKEPSVASLHLYTFDEAFDQEILTNAGFFTAPEYKDLLLENNQREIVIGDTRFVSIHLYSFSKEHQLVWIGSGTEITTPTNSYILSARHIIDSTRSTLYFYCPIPEENASGTTLYGISEIRFPLMRDVDIILAYRGKAASIVGDWDKSFPKTNDVHFSPNYSGVFGAKVRSIRTGKEYRLGNSVRILTEDTVPYASLSWNCIDGQSGEGFVGTNGLFFVLKGRSGALQGKFDTLLLTPFKIQF